MYNPDVKGIENNKELNRIVSGGRHIVARFFIDYPGQSISGKQLYNEKTDASTIQIDIKSLNIKEMILVKVNTDQNVSMHKAFIR